MLQNDTGSALVYGSFLFMFYREGFNRWVYVVLIMVVSLFVFSFLLDPAALLIVLLLVCVISEGLTNGYWRSKLIYVAALTLFVALLYMLLPMLGGSISLHTAILVGVVLSLGLVAAYAYRYKVRNVLMFVLFFFGSLAFTYSIDYAFDNILQTHQQKRILDLLGLESDLKGWGYNVNQSKIAMVRAASAGKGFLEGPKRNSTSCGAKHRFHFLYGGRGVGIPGQCPGHRAVRHPDPAAGPYGRTANGALRPDLLLLRRIDLLFPRTGQYRHDYRTDAGDRYSAAVFQLRRLVDDRVYRTAVCGDTARFR